MPTEGPSLTANEQRVAALLAQGYTTSEIADELGVTLNTAGAYVSAVLVFMRRRGRQEAGETGGLTAREAEVAQLVREGASDRDIATQLGISMRTAEDHVYRILKNFGYHSRSDITKNLPESGAEP